MKKILLISILCSIGFGQTTQVKFKLDEWEEDYNKYFSNPGEIYTTLVFDADKMFDAFLNIHNKSGELNFNLKQKNVLASDRIIDNGIRTFLLESKKEVEAKCCREINVLEKVSVQTLNGLKHGPFEFILRTYILNDYDKQFHEDLVRLKKASEPYLNYDTDWLEVVKNLEPSHTLLYKNSYLNGLAHGPFEATHQYIKFSGAYLNGLKNGTFKLSIDEQNPNTKITGPLYKISYKDDIYHGKYTIYETGKEKMYKYFTGTMEYGTEMSFTLYNENGKVRYRDGSAKKEEDRRNDRQRENLKKLGESLEKLSDIY